MNIIQYFIPGKYEDVYFYDGNLLCITDEKSLSILSLNELTDTIADRALGAFPLFEFLLSRNVWFHYEPFGQILRTPEILESIKQVLSAISGTPRELPVHQIEVSEFHLNDPGDFVLDVNVYFKRLFIGGTECLQSVDLLPEHGTYSLLGQPTTRVGEACYKSNVFMGALHASLGQNGLHSTFDEFSNNSFSKTLDVKSIRTSHVSTGFVNYETYNQAKIYDTIVKIGEKKTVRGTMIDLAPEGYDISSYLNPTTIEDNSNTLFSHQVGRRLHIVKEDGSIYFSELRLNRSGNMIGYARRPKLIGQIDDQIIGISVVVGALVIETLDGVYVVSKEEKTKIHHGTVMNVRTFPNSKQYRHIAVITADEGIYITIIVDLDAIKDRFERKLSYRQWLKENYDWSYELDEPEIDT